MKILYSIQATGNGHIARANELLSYFSRHGDVDVFLSGSNSSLPTTLPVKYRSKGLSLFYGNHGGLDYWKICKAFAPVRIINEARQLPVEKYDMVISDFEAITALACKIKNIPFIHFGHQASFISGKTPRPPKKDLAGEWILQHYCTSSNSIGLHFKSYDKNIFSPVLKEAILKAEPVNNGHITVYLSHYSDAIIQKTLARFRHLQFHVFSKFKTRIERTDNIVFMPVSNDAFTKSMITSCGVISGAGFETPAEALFLGKKLMCLPIQGQYEQLCNAAAVKEFGASVIHSIDYSFYECFENWLNCSEQPFLKLNHSTSFIVEKVIEKGLEVRKFKLPFYLPRIKFSI